LREAHARPPGTLWAVSLRAGGDNRCPFGDAMDVRDATRTVDGTELIKDGDLKLKLNRI
jgi:hypothetical protein